MNTKKYRAGLLQAEKANVGSLFQCALPDSNEGRLLILLRTNVRLKLLLDDLKPHPMSTVEDEPDAEAAEFMTRM